MVVVVHLKTYGFLWQGIPNFIGGFFFKRYKVIFERACVKIANQSQCWLT